MEKYICKFCEKKCKNQNSLVQHQIRCKNNPNRRAFNFLADYSHKTRLGQTKNTNKDIKHISEKLKERYLQGYTNPLKGKKKEITYLYKLENDIEINKWFDFIKNFETKLEIKETITNGKHYKIIRGAQIKEGKTVKPLFEHDFIANQLLNGNLSSLNTVHHIDNNPLNNSIYNLMVFENSSEHKRFHNSKYARLLYNNKTHLFTCIIDKQNMRV